MSTPIPLDDVGEQLLAELLAATETAAPLLHQIEGDLVSSGTHVGNRRPRNEDRVAVARVDFPSGFTYAAYIVCDGVGGSQRGEEAAAIACAAVISRLSAQREFVPPETLLPTLIREADDTVRVRLGGSGMTTLCMLLNCGAGGCALASVGDSRAYSWDTGSKLIQITEDDTLANEVKHHNLALSKSYLSARGLEGSLSQAIGEAGRQSGDLDITVFTQRSLPPGGILIATDGTWINGQEAFEQVATHSRGPSELIRRLLTVASWLGGSDNASALAIRDPQLVPWAPTLVGKHTRITVWLTDKRIVLYRPSSTSPDLPLTTPKIEKRTRNKRKKPAPKSTQLELQPADSAKKDPDIVAGPDED